MQKKIFGIVLMLCILVTSFPAAAVPSEFSAPSLSVGNTTVTPSDSQMHYWKEEDGVYTETNHEDYQFAVHYDASSDYTLYLNNVNITTYNIYGIGVDCNSSLNVFLMDGTENSISALSNGVLASNTLRISGTGILAVTAGQYSIGLYSSGGDVTIENGSITTEGRCGIYAPAGNIVISGGTVAATGMERGLETFGNFLYCGGSLTAIAMDSGEQAIGAEDFSAVGTLFKYRTNLSAVEPATPFQFYPDTEFTVEELENYQFVCMLPTLLITTSTNENGSIGAAVEGVSTTSAYPADSVTLIATPDTGYSHVSWNVYQTDNVTVTTTVYGNTFTMPTFPVTVVASFTLNTYTVDYFYNNGSFEIYATQTDIPHGSILTAPTPPTRSGYAFVGWYKEPGGTNPWNFASETVTGALSLYAKWIQNPTPSDENTTPVRVRTITVSEVSCALFPDALGKISASANMNSAFSSSVEVKVTEIGVDRASFGLSAGSEVYPFDISLYIKGTNQKTSPKEGYAVTLSLPVPENLLDQRETLIIVHKSDIGTVTTIASRLEQVGGIWYLVFDATAFSPYAIVDIKDVSYDQSAGVPYYLTDKSKVFIGFAANGRYIAPASVTVSVMHNSKYFSDISGHWAVRYIDFVTEREIFLGTGANAFSPNTVMTRAMFATVIGRLFERSYAEIETLLKHTFADCDYDAYYGKYIDWASENGIISGYGNGMFGPDDQITREQMAAILYRFSSFLDAPPDKTENLLNYPDVDAISDDAKNAASFCRATNIISGCAGGLFAPQETATRAEVAATIQRFITLIVNLNTN